MPLEIIQDFIPKGRPNRPGLWLTGPLYITIHDTGNASPGADALAHAAWLKGDQAAAVPVSYHFTVDEQRAIQHLPLDEIGWHAGDGRNGPGNSSSIGIEIAMNQDGDRLRAEWNAVLLVVDLLQRFGLTPEEVVQHHRWNGKNCPRVLRGRPGGWDGFIEAVKKTMAPKSPVASPSPGKIRIFVAGRELATQAVRVGDKIYLPIRDVGEAMGAQVDWKRENGEEIVRIELPPPPDSPQFADPVHSFPRFDRGANYDCITARPEMLEVQIIRGRLPLDRDGINGGFTDAVLGPLGVAVVDGILRTDRVPFRPPRPVFWVKGDKAQIDIVDQASGLKADYALGAGPILLPRLDVPAGDFQADILDSIRPRSAVGITTEGLVKLVVTGPLSMPQLANLMQGLGCREAMAMDGGGSVAMTWGRKTIRGNERAVSTAILLKTSRT